MLRCLLLFVAISAAHRSRKYCTSTPNPHSQNPCMRSPCQDRCVNPCQHGGYCITQYYPIGSYCCGCPTGFTGINCQDRAPTRPSCIDRLPAVCAHRATAEACDDPSQFHDLFYNCTRTCNFCNECRHGWTPFNDHCYKHNPTRLTVAEAQSGCLAQGAVLAAPRTWKENLFIWQLGGRRDLWVNAQDSAREGTWVWQDNMRNVSWDNWLQHDDFRGVEGDDGDTQNCAVMRRGHGHQWWDVSCMSMAPSVCVQTKLR